MAVESPVVKQRLTFSWSLVSSGLRMQLLDAVDWQAGQVPAERLYLSEEALNADLVRLYGRQPSMAALDKWDAWEPIFDWLLREATAAQLDDLIVFVQRSLSGPDRHVKPKNLAERRAFVTRRMKRQTRTLKANALSVFVRAHKERRPVRSRGRQTGSAESRGVRMLCGMGGAPAPLHDYQREAVANLSALTRARSGGSRRGLVVLPTGAGKTRVAVSWALDLLSSDPAWRVLWIAHQEELLSQAAATFESLAASKPLGFVRRLRVVSGQASPVSTLADPDIDLAIVTWQSVYSNWQRGARLLRTFTARPTAVFVDEAHHAGSPAYEKILGHLEDSPRVVMVGLTATPWPSNSVAAERLRSRFPRMVAQVSIDELHARRILAVPVLHTVDTHQQLELTPAELRLANGDLPPTVLRQLKTTARDQLLVRTWQERRDEWGKSLVFATSTGHADQLGSSLEQAGASVRVLHSRVDVDRREVLDWFAGPSEDQAVLVSVGMLTEGVDIPAARTAFLARPTTSRILMRQMIGRVLRGPSAGGEATAHLVYLRDVWTNFDEVIEPDELPDIAVTTTGHERGEAERAFPPVHALGGGAVPHSVLAQLARSYARRVDRIPLDPATSRTALCGYYVTDAGGHVPVMEHQRDGFEELIRRVRAGRSFQGTPLASLFDDDHPPYPTDRQLASIRAHVEITNQAPPFVALNAELDPRTVAVELRSRVLDDAGREAFLREQYETSLARIAYRSLDHFEEAVERELRELRHAERSGRSRSNPERPAPPEHSNKPEMVPLRRWSSRQLPSMKRIIARVCEVLAGEEVIEPLHKPGFDPPSLDWTRTDVGSTWAHWSLKTSGKGKGKPSIRVNRLLQAPRKDVGDDILEYLIFHELLHDLLPGRGHDAEFRRLEGRWPEVDHLDFMLDTLHEQFGLRRTRR